jgi:PGF-CTERM protein/surface glycoprotein (TIGR04207 family)
MTTDTTKTRAVFLAALMVFSIFAGTVAFSGSVAEVNDPAIDDGSITNTTVVETSNNTHSVQLNATLNSTNDTYVNYNLSLDSDFDLSEAANSTVQVDQTSGVVSVADTSFDTTNDNFTVNLSTDGTGVDNDKVNLTYDLTGVKAPSVSSTTDYPVTFAVDNGTDGSVEASTNIGPLTVENTPSGAPEFNSATHYDDVGGEGSGVEIAFSEPVKIPSASDVTLYEDGSEVTGTSISPAPSSDTLSGRYFISTGSVLTGDLEISLSSDIEDASGDSLPSTDTGNNSVTFAPVTIQETDDESAYKGGNVAIVSDGTNHDVEIEGPDGYYFSGSTGTNSEVFVFNTSERDLGEYDIGIDGSSLDNTQLTLRDLGLGLSVDDYDVTTAEAIEGTVEASASERSITVELRDSGGDAVDGSETAATLNGQGEYDFSFDPSSSGLDLDAGNYTVHVTDDYSGVEVESSAVAVSAAGDEEVDFAQSVVTDQRGDVVEFTVEMQQTSTATVRLGTEEQGVVSNVTVEDDDGDDQVTVYLNTTALEDAEATYGDGGNVYSLGSDSDDEIVTADIGTNVSDLIDAGEYDLEVRPEGASSSTDVATLVLEERGTTEINTWTAPDSVDPSDLEELTEAIADGEVTRTSDVANGDLVVHQLVTSGFEGTFDAQHNEEITQRFLDMSEAGTVYNFSIEQTNAGANQEPFALNLSTENATVVADGDNDTYYVVVDTGEVNTYDGNAIPDDEGLTANFTVFNDDANDFTSEDLDSDENEETLVDYEVVEPTVSVDEPYNVSNAAEQTVGGGTTLAPGTELTLRVRSTDGTSPSFLKTASPVVQSDRTWSAEFDFAERNVGDTYEIVVDDGTGGADEVTEDGTVVEAVETPTATPEPETDPSQTETDTSSPGTDTPEPDTATPEPAAGTSEPTETSTPGFGVVVALTALLAAALLAARRES